MSATTDTSVTTVSVVGGIMPSNVITRVVAGDLPGMTAGEYHLASGDTPRQAASKAWSALQSAYTSYKADLQKLAENDAATALTRDKWLQQILVQLGYGRVQPTPGGHLTAGAGDEEREYPISHLWQDVPMHLLGWNLDLDRGQRGVAGAARAPQSMLQEYLNRTPEHLWAILSNGRTLRLLRDSTALVGQAFIEFDLETMFDGELFSDFVVLYLMCNQSRLERRTDEDGQPGPVTDRWIETWRTEAIAQGTRALTSMRGQVEHAIEALGTGFYSHPANTDLRERLQHNEMTPADLQRALLRIVYRLLFWFVADDRGLLLAPGADPEAVTRYRRLFSSTRLRSVASRRIGTRHDDLWQQASLVLNGLGEEGGRPELGLPGLGGLFDLGPMDALQDCQISNRALLEAVRLLSHTEDKTNKRRMPVDFAHLGAEELGGIYEGLLELHPRLNPAEKTFTLEAAAGNERKTSGSYYTPADLIALVLDETLDPVLDEAVQEDDPEAALLKVTVCDPACGSGHFLVAAAKRIANRVAQVRSGESEPAQPQVQSALREVVASCIYGVDLNPMAAELAKVSLWLEAVEPGRPLAFLDANIRVGNALLGTTPALLSDGVPDAAFKALTGDDKPTVTALKKRNKTERQQAAQGDLFGSAGIPVANTALADQLQSIAETGRTGSLADQHHAANRLAAYEDSPQTRHAIDVADAWCAAFTQPKNPDSAPIAVTDKVLRDWATSSPEHPAVPEQTRQLVAQEAAQHRFFHWHLEFPQIYSVPRDEAAHTDLGWTGGFTVMVGNPPWETVQMSEKEFFVGREPAIAEASNAAQRKKMIATLESTNQPLYLAYLSELRQTEAENQLARGGRFPLTARGKVNTYALFAETFRTFIAYDGRCGFITPTGLATDKTTAPFFADTLRSKRLAAFYDFENEAKIFPSVHNQFRFAASVMSGGKPQREARLAFYTRYIQDVPSRRFELDAGEALLLNPNTGTLPVFRSRRDAEITLGIYRRHPILIRDPYQATGEPEQNPWGLSLKQGLFNMASDSGLFRTAEDLETLWARFDGWAWESSRRDSSRTRWLPLYEGKMLSHWDDRHATYKDATQAQLNKGTLPYLSDTAHDDPTIGPLARYWVEESDVANATGERTNGGWMLAFRRLTQASNVRTLIPAVLPSTAAGDNMWLAFLGRGKAECFQAALSSLVADFVVRQKLSGTTLSAYYMEQLACPSQETLERRALWGEQVLSDWITARVLELTYTSYRIAGYARDIGDDGEPFRWLPDRRFAIQCELDAAMMHVYGLQRDEAEHILDSFQVMRKYEEAPPDKGGYGEFRTKRMVLEFYDLMAEAAATNPAHTLSGGSSPSGPFRPYDSPISPPPGEGPRHPPRAEA